MSPAVKRIASRNSWLVMSFRSKSLPVINRWWRRVNKPKKTSRIPNVLVSFLFIFRRKKVVKLYLGQAVFLGAKV